MKAPNNRITHVFQELVVTRIKTLALEQSKNKGLILTVKEHAVRQIPRRSSTRKT